MRRPIADRWPQAYRAWLRKLAKASLQIVRTGDLTCEIKLMEKNLSAESGFMAGWSERGLAERKKAQR